MASPPTHQQSPPFDLPKFFIPSQQPSPPPLSSSSSSSSTTTTISTATMSGPTPIPSSSYPPSTGSHHLHPPHFPPFPYPNNAPPPQFHHYPPFQQQQPPQHDNNNPNNNFFSNPSPLASMHHHPQRSLSYPTPPLQPPQSPSPRHHHHLHNNNSAAEIMALLRPPSQDPQPPTPTPTPSHPQHLPLQQQQQQQQQPHPPQQHPSPTASSEPTVPPLRMPSSKMPRGRRITGDHAVYDVDVRLPGEVQPQLEVTPITKYMTDPQLCLGRQIAVNKSYICYGLKQGNIRILNINTALRSLFRTQSQRVTDMAFFAEDVHLLASAGVDGRINIWKISEGPDEEDKPQITGKTVIALQIVGEGEVRNPRVCWHCYKQEILVVGIGKHVLRIDTNKVGKGEVYSSEAPLHCPVDKLIDGIQLVGGHDAEVSDLSMCQWMTTRLVSASMDGTIKIWEDHKAVPLVVLRPHDGQPVYSASFLTAINRPDHIILITVGPQNREVKIWVSSSEEGWLLPSDADSLTCIQTLELKSSAEPRFEEVFFNQVAALSQVGLLLLANAKRNAIYAIHLEYGPNPAATRMDYISEFTVTMPILSLTGTNDVLHGQSVAQIYCVQTQAIQQYTLDLSRCLPPPLENVSAEKSDSSVSLDVASVEGFIALDSRGSKFSDVPIISASVDAATSLDIPSPNMESNSLALAPSNVDANVGVPSSPSRQRFSEVTIVARSEAEGLNQLAINYSIDHQIDSIHATLSDMPSLDSDLRNDDKKVSQNDNTGILNPHNGFKQPTHLVTPSEILMGVSSSEITNLSEGKSTSDANILDVVVNGDVGNAEVEVKVVQTRCTQDDEHVLSGEPKHLVSENKERFFCSQASDLGVEMTRMSAETYTEEESRAVDGPGVVEFPAQPSHSSEEEVRDSTKDVSGRVSDSAIPTIIPQSTTPSTKGKKQKGKNAQASSSSQSAFNSTDSSNGQGGTSNLLSGEAACPQILAMQELLNQLVASQKEMQKQMSNLVAVPVSKECRRLEAALGRSIEKAVKANTDALWARFQEENVKNEKLLRDRTQQIASLISNFINKDLTAMFEKALKKELASIGPAVVRTISPVIEKTISSSIADSFQKGVGDKAVNQLEKSVNSKLEATVARQIQAQFQTSGKQALQEALKAGLEASLIPAFEMSCKAMFEQVDATFRKGMVEHATAAQQLLESQHSSLALTLREAINSASSLTQTLSGELADSQRKLLALAAAGANSSAVNTLVTQLSNGPLADFHDKAEIHLDPTKELLRLVAERKYEEAFTIALHRNDVFIVSWLCSQVDLRGILSMSPLPLSQGVLLALLQQLSCDVISDTTQKIAWMTYVACSINPADPMIGMHVGEIGKQVYQNLMQLGSQATVSNADLMSLRALTRVINSMMTCK